MNFNRRFVLIALGTAAIATGLIFGSGAFTQVEAERAVNVNVADDANAFLAMQSTSDLSGTNADNVVEINLDGTGTSANGINYNATTTVDPVLNVTNNGGQEVVLSYNQTATPEGLSLEFNQSATTTLPPGATANVSITAASGPGAPTYINGGYLNGTGANDVSVTINATAN